MVLNGKNIQYELPGKTGTKVFDSADARRARQRAAVYGALDYYVGGDLPETEWGVLPTSIANESVAKRLGVVEQVRAL